MVFKLYQILTSILAPFVNIYLYKRIKTGKEDATRFKERFGNSALPRPKGGLIWIHAASVGESLSVLPLINRLAEENKDMNLLLTTGTVTSASIVESKLPDNAFHQYTPIDRVSCVTKFIKHWKPGLALWVESELWPNLVTETGKNCPMILINARISDKSYKMWQRYRSLSKYVLSRFSLTLPQSKIDGERLKELGARQIKFYGNIKFDSPPLSSDPKKMGELVSLIGDRPVWMAASTHEGEEEMIAKIHKELKEAYPSLLTIIAPRNPKRSQEIIDQIEKRDLDVAVRSKEQDIKDSTDIYLADTIGELGVFYRLVSIVFIGGSLVKHGGQNPLEPSRLECAVIFGSNMDNFKDIRDEYVEKNAAIEVRDEKSLQSAVEELLSDHDKQEKLSQAALELVNKKSGIIDSYIEEISPYIEKIRDNENETNIA